MVVVAVKPADVPALISQIAGAVQSDQIVLSLAAGIPTSRFEEAMAGVPVVRAMPNTPAQIDQAITALCGGAHADDSSLDAAERVLSAVGGTIRLDEYLLDAVTAVSGTGPAYVFLMAEALTEAAIREDYQGIRPAPGYPACPDHTAKRTLFALLHAETRAGIRLTESFAMVPAASVCGYYFWHPEARYFGVGKIGRDQIEDYAARKRIEPAAAERWLAPNLAYEP